MIRQIHLTHTRRASSRSPPPRSLSSLLFLLSLFFSKTRSNQDRLPTSVFKLAIKYLLGTHIPLGGNSHVVKHVTPLARDNLRRVSWIARKRLVRRRSYHDEETMDGKWKLIFLFALFVVGFLLIYLLFCCLRLWRQPAFVCHYDNKKTLADNPVSAMHWRPAIPPS